MAVDPSVLSQLDTAHARGVAAAAGVDATSNQTMQQLAMQIAVASEYDQRMMNGFLSTQLFNTDVVAAKTAYHTPVEPGAAPLATPPSK